MENTKIMASEFGGNQKNAKIRPKVLFFDVNETLLDLTAMKDSVARILGNREDLFSLWFTTMLQYSLVNTAGGKHEDFGVIGAATLQMVALNQGISLTEKQAQKAIIPSLLSLPAHPEVKASLSQLKEAGYKLVSFTNSSNKAVHTQFENAGLIDFFEVRLSIEDIGKYKPNLATYDWAARKLGLPGHECMLIAAHGWDIAGALWANWRGAFIHRKGAQLYPLAPSPEIIATDLQIATHKLLSLK